MSGLQRAAEQNGRGVSSLRKKEAASRMGADEEAVMKRSWPVAVALLFLTVPLSAQYIRVSATPDEETYRTIVGWALRGLESEERLAKIMFQVDCRDEWEEHRREFVAEAARASSELESARDVFEDDDIFEGESSIRYPYTFDMDRAERCAAASKAVALLRRYLDRSDLDRETKRKMNEHLREYEKLGFAVKWRGPK